MALSEVFRLKEVRVSDKFDDAKKAFVNDMSEKFDFPIIPVSSPEKAVEGADIVVTATNSPSLIFPLD